MKLKQVQIVTALILLIAPLSGSAGESCAMFGGTCRDACGKSEGAEAGAFDDCGEKQDCCTARSVQETRCCVLSFEQKDHGPGNCAAPVQGACAKGSASSVPCDKLVMCR